RHPARRSRPRRPRLREGPDQWRDAAVRRGRRPWPRLARRARSGRRHPAEIRLQDRDARPRLLRDQLRDGRHARPLRGRPPVVNVHAPARPGSNEAPVFVVGLGSYLPGEPVANEVIARRMPSVPVLDLMRYFGVEQRHFVVDPATGARIEEGLGTSGMACRAASAAAADGGLAADDIDLIITTTATPDVIMPPLARQVQRRLGIERAQLFDLRGGCAAAIQGLILARTMIRSGLARAALICGAECMSPYYY